MATNNVDLNYPRNYFKIPIKNLFFGGVPICDIKNNKLKLLHRIYFFMLCLSGSSYVITEFIYIHEHWNEMEEVTHTLCYTLAHLIGIGKLIVLTVKGKEIGRFLKSFEAVPFSPNVERGGAEEINIVRKAVHQTKIQFTVYMTIVATMITTRTIPFLRNNRIMKQVSPNITEIIPLFPYPSLLPFNVDFGLSPYYELAFFYQLFNISLFGWYLGNTDTINTGLMIHITAQFKIVINAILTVTKRAARMTKGKKKFEYEKENIIITYKEPSNTFLIEKIERYDNEFMNNLKLCVDNCAQHHQEIINLVDEIEETFSVLFLIQFFGFLLSLCVGLYQTSLLPIGNPLFMSMSAFSLAITFELLIHCWNGNEISLYSSEILNAVYNCEWIRADNDIKKSLLLIMMRAQRQSYLTAGKFSKISLETFVSILRGSVSYFTVLRQMNDQVVNNAE